MTNLKEGQIIEITKAKVYVSNFPEMFLRDNGDFSMRLTSGELEIGTTQRGLDTTIFSGDYIVTKTAYGGGSGPGSRDEFPDGHRVWAKRIYKNLNGDRVVSEFEISFYQSGCFTCMIEKPKVVGNGKPIYVIED
jgi:hypothetical protein